MEINKDKLILAIDEHIAKTRTELEKEENLALLIEKIKKIGLGGEEYAVLVEDLLVNNTNTPFFKEAEIYHENEILSKFSYGDFVVEILHNSSKVINLYSFKKMIVNDVQKPKNLDKRKKVLDEYSKLDPKDAKIKDIKRIEISLLESSGFSSLLRPNSSNILFYTDKKKKEVIFESRLEALRKLVEDNEDEHKSYLENLEKIKMERLNLYIEIKELLERDLRIFKDAGWEVNLFIGRESEKFPFS